jgi:hypothetical protein
MDCKAIALAAVMAAAGCGPAYLTAATQPTWNVKGPLASVIAASGGGHTASVGLGLGGQALGFEATLHAVDVGAATFALPPGLELAGGAVPATAADEGRYATMHSTLEARWQVVRWRGLGLHVRGGTSHGVVLDKMTLDRAWGLGYKAGAGVALRLHAHVVIWVDAAQTTFGFARGPAEGTSTLRGVTVGIALGR